MTPADFRVIREHLGLTTAWLATHFDVAERSVQRWERAESPVPGAVADEMRELERRTRDQVAELAKELAEMTAAGEPAAVQTFFSDAEYRRQTDGTWTASWHRAMVGRAIEAYGRPATVEYASTGA
jgi:hypothetical protein